ncbi:MAG: ATP-binding protein [Rhodothermales bacterium]|nr:ATP-binding protein [Rhodothermales bacterium]MBO6778661.1 ATP-binding protein [Rhodothermales bacterium]
MIIIHGVNNPHDLISRHLTSVLDRHLRSMPVVVMTGARQTGKSTLAQFLLHQDRIYHTLDDLDALELVGSNPGGLIGDRPVTIDEVQRMPELLLSVKRSVDADRVAGRFLLTGSANLLLMQRVSEPLAGRASYLTLRPCTRGELSGLPPSLWTQLQQVEDREWQAVIQDSARPAARWAAVARRGGFPTPALGSEEHGAASPWYQGYIRTYLERDLQDLSSISSLVDFRRLMRLVAARTGQIQNQSNLARDLGMAQPTVHRYLNLLETSYMLVRLPAYTANRGKRLIKSPRIYWGDTGLGLHMSGSPDPTGAHLENLILLDLLTSQDCYNQINQLYYWRTTTGQEVDFVIEGLDGRLMPIEVKATAKPRLGHCRGLNAFLDEYGKLCRSALLLHAGSETRWLTPRILATPWWAVA